MTDPTPRPPAPAPAGDAVAPPANPADDPLATLHRLATRFAAAGHALFLVGGGVRDRLMGRPLHDFDLATDARPAAVRACLQEAGASALWGVGERFGTVGAIVDGLTIEVTTFRGARPGEFANTLAADLGRRDFTINAMAIHLLRGRLIDPHGGEHDLAARRIRAVGDPAERFREDPLRLLRAVRFAAELGFELEVGTLAALVERAPLIAEVAVERIGAELGRIMVSPQPDLGLRLLVDTGLARHVLPELLPLRGGSRGRARHKDVFEHSLQVVTRVPPRPALRWAALLHDVAKPRTFSVENGEVHYFGHEELGAQMATEILTRLRLDSATIERVAILIAQHGRANAYDSDWTDSAVRRFVREAGDALDDLLALSRADITSQRPARVAAGLARTEELAARCRQVQAEADLAKLTSPLDGHELMRLFNRPPGRWVGRVKDHLTELVVDGALAPNDKATAERIARDLLAREEGSPAP